MLVQIITVLSALGAAAAVSPKHSAGLPAFSYFLVFLGTQCLIVQVYRIFIWPFYVSPLRHLPTPENNTFFLGQLVNQTRRPSPNTEFLSWMRRWPDASFIRYLTFANSEVLLVNSLSAHRQVVQTKCYSFEKPIWFKRLLGEITGNGLLFSVGDAHKAQKRQLSGPFSPSNIRQLYPVFREKSAELISYLEASVSGSPSGDFCVLDMDSLFIKTALDVIGVAALGVDLNNMSSQGSSLNFFDNYHYLFHQPELGSLVTLLNAFVPLRWMPLEVNRKFRRAVADIRNMLQELVRERFKSGKRAGAGESGKDILTFMLQAMDSGDAKWTEEELVDHLLQFVTAGHETAATSLVLIMGTLAAEPQCQARLREEIWKAMAQTSELDAHALDALPYLNNVIREVLRVSSPALMVPSEAQNDVEIDGVLIPKGTALMIAPQVIQHNPLIWGPDAAEFKPERWEHLSETAAIPYAFEAFHNGPRSCLGKGLAMLQIKTLMADMLTRFSFEPVDRMGVFENPSFTLRPKGGLRIKVKRL
ncbi:cytochrome P450 [Thozetella sp. PMI_491]|nr:cytochrome P450 [Thozetella sp. PMI_491]